MSDNNLMWSLMRIWIQKTKRGFDQIKGTVGTWRRYALFGGSFKLKINVIAHNKFVAVYQFQQVYCAIKTDSYDTMLLFIYSIYSYCVSVSRNV